MKRILSIAVVFALFTACAPKEEAKTGNQEEHSGNTTQMLLGNVELKDFQQAAYAEWFNTEKNAYTADEALMNEISLDGYQVLVVFGTWCGDSRREVPRFVKLMEYKGFSNVEWCAVDRTKLCEGRNAEELNIQRVPTFIFYKDGVEVGRIIESPTESLEKDMKAILAKK